MTQIGNPDSSQSSLNKAEVPTQAGSQVVGEMVTEAKTHVKNLLQSDPTAARWNESVKILPQNVVREIVRMLNAAGEPQYLMNILSDLQRPRKELGFVTPQTVWSSAMQQYVEQSPYVCIKNIESILQKHGVDRNVCGQFWAKLLLFPLDQHGQEIKFGQEGNRWTDAESANAFYKNGGWKLHITVQPKNYAAVDRWLFTHHKGQYKLLSGGSHEEGTDFTIYVGDRDHAELLSQKIEEQIGSLLDKNTVGSTDRMFTKNVAGRFDIQTTANARKFDLRYYGIHGIPFDTFAMNATSVYFYKEKTTENEAARTAEYEKQRARIDRLLMKEYGEYYTGTKTP